MQSTQVTAEKPRTITLLNGQPLTITSNEATAAETIPLIDVSGMFSDKIEDRKAVAKEIREASRNIGFFYMTNHVDLTTPYAILSLTFRLRINVTITEQRVDMSQAADVIDQAKKFFALPMEKKLEVDTNLIPDMFCGYHPMQRNNYNKLKHQGSGLLSINGVPKLTLREDLHEAFNWEYDAAKDPEFPDSTLDSTNLWPSGMPEFQEKLSKYQMTLLTLARKLTRMFALALDLPENSFDENVIRPKASMRILRYPEQLESRDDQHGIGAHTDVDYFSIISQDTEGLEVLSKSGNWIKALPIKGTFVVNIGDCFMRQTNDFFVSTVHRVINQSGRERISVPFFLGFDRKTILNPIPTCVSEDRPQKYKIITAGEYYTWRHRRAKDWLNAKEGETLTMSEL